jgi:acetylornithine deacetylase/succinyl-diaminopimelate desuccinylase-like protein
MSKPDLGDTLEGLQRQALRDLLMDLVRIPSLSGEEGPVMEFAADFLRARGFEVELVGRPHGPPNVLANLGTGESPVVVLNGHLDTVPAANPEQWDSDPHEPLAIDGRVAGLGALDMKGSCAAMMLALDAIRQHGEDLHGTIQLQLVADEEAEGYFGTPYLLELIEDGKLLKPDHVIVGEFTGLKIMTAERGSFKFLVKFNGRATHTANARVDGHNAIYAAAEAIRLLEGDLDIEHPEVGSAVISVNQIRGGNYRSQVPDTCTIQVDRRLVPGETMESVLADTARTIEGLRTSIPWLDFAVAPDLDDRGQARYAPPNLSRRDIASATAVRKAHEKVTGQPAEFFRGWFGATDARCFRYAGYDAINYGPVGLHAHGPNEFVVEESLRTQMVVLALAVADLCGIRSGGWSPLRNSVAPDGKP